MSGSQDQKSSNGAGSQQDTRRKKMRQRLEGYSGPIRPRKVLASGQHVPGLVIISSKISNKQDINMIVEDINLIHNSPEIDVVLDIDYQRYPALKFNDIFGKITGELNSELKELEDEIIFFLRIDREAKRDRDPEKLKRMKEAPGIQLSRGRREAIAQGNELDYATEANSVIGAPHSVVADPHSVVADPHTPIESFKWQPNADQQFGNQWALKNIGMVPNISTYKGKGTRVVVFDTYPQESGVEITAAVKQDTWNDNLNGSDVSITPMTEVFFTQNKYGIRNHGLFVTSLIQAVTPETEVEVIQVLDEEGTGDAASLIFSLFEYARVIVDKRTSAGTIQLQNPLQGIVFNLSLGLTDRRDDSEREEALQKVIKLIHGLGGVVVVAAGNDSDEFTGAQPPHPVVIMKETIGVGASSIEGTKTTYSNEGDIMAPGGENSYFNYLEKALSDHIRAPNQSRDLQEFPNGLIGRIRNRDGELGYGVAAGTSFSTALVSGMAALLLSTNPSLSPAAVKEIIQKSSVPTGVINVERALVRVMETLAPAPTA